MTGLSERQRYWPLGDIAGHHRLPHVELLIFDDRCVEIEEGRPSRYCTRGSNGGTPYIKAKLRTMRLLVIPPPHHWGRLFTIPRNIATAENKIPANNRISELLVKFFAMAATGVLLLLMPLLPLLSLPLQFLLLLLLVLALSVLSCYRCYLALTQSPIFLLLLLLLLWLLIIKSRLTTAQKASRRIKSQKFLRNNTTRLVKSQQGKSHSSSSRQP